MRRNQKRLLMVEGKNDQHVVFQLAERHQIPECFEVRDYEGVDSLLEEFPERLKESERERVGVLVDADANLLARWEKLRKILRQAGYDDVPMEPVATGTIIPAPNLFRPVVGIWMMPDNTVPGVLEHFLQFLIPHEDQLISLAKQAVANIPPERRRFIIAHEVKAQIHTWLAWQKVPGVPFGTAIKARYLDGDRDEAHVFVDWLRRLFVEDIAATAD